MNDCNSDEYTGEVSLVWEGDRPAGIDERVIANIRLELSGLSQPSDLCFHHVFFGSILDGPCVFVYGETGSQAFHCEYLPDGAGWTNE